MIGLLRLSRYCTRYRLERVFRSEDVGLQRYVHFALVNTPTTAMASVLCLLLLQVLLDQSLHGLHDLLLLGFLLLEIDHR